MTGRTIASTWAAVRERGQRLADRSRQTRLVRAALRTARAHGGPLAGGIAYAALFSIVAGLAIAYTTVVRILGADAELRAIVIGTIDSALPGIIDHGDGSGLVSEDQLLLAAGANIAGLVAIGVLLVSATTLMAALRRAIRAMFGIVAPSEHPIMSKARDLVGFATLGAAVLAASILGIASGLAGDTLFGWLGVEGSRTGLRVLGFATALVLDATVFALLVRYLAGVRAPRRDLLVGALAAGVAGGAVRLLGATIVQVALNNPFLASFAAVVALLLWVNIMARITLVVAAYVANPAAPPPRSAHQLPHVRERPNYVTLSAPHTLAWPHNPSTGEVLTQGQATEG